MLVIIANEGAEASLEGWPGGPISAQSVQGGRGKKKPKPPSSKAKKYPHHCLSRAKKGPQ